MSLWSYIGIGIVAIIAWKFIKEIGKGLPILEFLLLIAGLQWIIGPINSYRSSAQHFKYYMYVDEGEYMSYVVPAFLIFSAIIIIKKKPLFNLSNTDFKNYSIYGKPILIIGIVADVLSSFATPSLAFFLFLLAQFKFIGAGILIFSSSRRDKFVFFAAIAYLFLRSLDSALFHDFLLWGAFFFMLWSLKYKPDLKKKTIIFLGAFVLVTGIQLVKGAFREQVWGGHQGNKISLLIDILTKELNTSDFTSDAEQEELNMRLNQGWIISAIMNHTPENQNFGNGETISEAISASLIPRFLSPDKAIADGRDNFIKYTGLQLSKQTAMGLSIMGEAYANYGVFGGFIFMLFYGFFLVLFWNKLSYIVLEHPIILFFIPLIFLQVVKAETQLLSVLNHLIKSSFLVILFYFSAKKLFKWNI